MPNYNMFSPTFLHYYILSIGITNYYILKALVLLSIRQSYKSVINEFRFIPHNKDFS